VVGRILLIVLLCSPAFAGPKLSTGAQYLRALLLNPNRTSVRDTTQFFDFGRFNESKKTKDIVAAFEELVAAYPELETRIQEGRVFQAKTAEALRKEIGERLEREKIDDREVAETLASFRRFQKSILQATEVKIDEKKAREAAERETRERFIDIRDVPYALWAGKAPWAIQHYKRLLGVYTEQTERKVTPEVKEAAFQQWRNDQKERLRKLREENMIRTLNVLIKETSTKIYFKTDKGKTIQLTEISLKTLNLSVLMKEDGGAFMAKTNEGEGLIYTEYGPYQWTSTLRVSPQAFYRGMVGRWMSEPWPDQFVRPETNFKQDKAMIVLARLATIDQALAAQANAVVHSRTPETVGKDLEGTVTYAELGKADWDKEQFPRPYLVKELERIDSLGWWGLSQGRDYWRAREKASIAKGFPWHWAFNEKIHPWTLKHSTKLLLLGAALLGPVAIRLGMPTVVSLTHPAVVDGVGDIAPAHNKAIPAAKPVFKIRLNEGVSARELPAYFPMPTAKEIAYVSTEYFKKKPADFWLERVGEVAPGDFVRVPLGRQLGEVRVLDADTKLPLDPSEYRVRMPFDKQTAVVDIHGSKTHRAVTVEFGYSKNAGPSAKPLFLDPQAMKEVTRELKEDGFTAIANRIFEEIALAEKAGVKIPLETIENIFSAESIYSFKTASKLSKTAKGRFSAYWNFQTAEGKLRGQCDCGAQIFNDYLQGYNRKTYELDHRVRAGYLRDAEALEITEADGHAWTEVGGKFTGETLVHDSTPRQKEPEKKPPADLTLPPKRARLIVVEEDGSRKPHAAKGPPPLSPLASQKALEELAELKKKLVEHPLLSAVGKKSDNDRLPTTLAVEASHAMENFGSGKATWTQTAKELKRLFPQSPELNSPEDLPKFFQEIGETVTAQLEHSEKLVIEAKLADFPLLGNPSLAGRVRELFNHLAIVPWHQMNFARNAKVCDVVLNGL